MLSISTAGSPDQHARAAESSRGVRFEVRWPVLRSVAVMTVILDFSFGADLKTVTEVCQTWLPGLILDVFWTMFRAGPIRSGPCAKLVRKTPENRRKQK